MKEKTWIRLTKQIGTGEDTEFLDISRVVIGIPEDPWFREEFLRDCLDMLDELQGAYVNHSRGRQDGEDLPAEVGP